MTAVTKFMFDVQFDSGFEPESKAVAESATPEVDGTETDDDSTAENDMNEGDEQEEELPRL
ncbi:MAG: hypothetical protein HQ501_05615 [Rhodospirillales bacterium]|nr:hypothetical protein [Rhodospirillales bacterium]